MSANRSFVRICLPQCQSIFPTVCSLLSRAGVVGLRTFCAEELARDVQGFTSDDNDLLAIEELLGDDTGKTAQEMALAVNDDLKDIKS